MGESTKAVCAVLMAVGVGCSAVAWVFDDPTAVTWAFRIGGLILAVASLALILKLHFRRDIEPDYLAAIAGDYVNRDGFCFTLTASAVKGVTYIEAYFQTQYDQPCVGQIAIRPARGFFLTRANIESVTFQVDCPPGGFGCVRVAIPVPQKLQGKKQAFDVGAAVKYPAGKGRRIRFRDGVFLRANTKFSDGFRTGLFLAGAATGSVLVGGLASPVTAAVKLPSDVAEELKVAAPPETELLWKLGDAPLKDIGQ